MFARYFYSHFEYGTIFSLVFIYFISCNNYSRSVSSKPATNRIMLSMEEVMLNERGYLK